MDPQPVFCPNPDCTSRGKVGEGNLKIHQPNRNRWKCKICNKTFSGNRGTPFLGLKTDHKIVTCVLTLLAFGCPIRAIVEAFLLDERTVADWQRRAGEHAEAVHQHLVVSQPRDLGHVQADELWAKMQRGPALWMAMAMQVTTRLWLGGVVGASRNSKMIWQLAKLVRSQALERALLVVTDGYSAYVNAWKRAFQTSVARERGRGAPRKRAWAQVVIGRVIKSYQKKWCLGVEHRVLAQGTQEEFEALRVGEQVLHTAYIERLNATFRQRLGGLVRRGRCLLRKEAVLHRCMYLSGCVYNFCTPHRSLRIEATVNQAAQERSPAMAAGITHEIWSVGQLLCYHVPPPPWVRPKNPKLGRPKGSKNKPKQPKEQLV
jgi:transposase-like protein/cation transport regulator ChaC